MGDELEYEIWAIQLFDNYTIDKHIQLFYLLVEFLKHRKFHLNS
jgi:hypothetical protein